MPCTSGQTVPSSCAPTQPPAAKAASIIITPFKAEAAPAACGKGPTQAAWPQGWCMPCATMNT